MFPLMLLFAIVASMEFTIPPVATLIVSMEPNETAPPPVRPEPALIVTWEFASIRLLTPPVATLNETDDPSATDPPPVRPDPAVTVSDELANAVLGTASHVTVFALVDTATVFAAEPAGNATPFTCATVGLG